jgi:hypothetical protein
MKKVISVLLALLMVFGVMSVGTVTAFAEDAETPVAAEEETTRISGYIPFSYDCDYCGETHTDFFGMLITMLHTVLQAAKLVVTAVKK